jgi:hypothetical protein
MTDGITPDAILAAHGATVTVLPVAKPNGHDTATAALRPGLATDAAAIPRRSWVGGPGWFIPSALNVASGAPGSLKSTLIGHIAVALAAGASWAGLEPERPYRVLLAHWEDDTDEMHRRMQAAADTIAPSCTTAIARNIALLHMADHGPLIQQAALMEPRPTAALAMLEQAAKDHGAEILILDPLAEAVAVAENDNAVLRLGLAPLRRLAQARKCPVIAIHHDRKGAEGTALDRMRGGSALGGLIRRHLPVRQMTAEQAREMNIAEDDADSFICLEQGKTQYSRQRGPAWFRTVSHHLQNGDDVAALSPWTPPTFTIGPEHLSAAIAATTAGIDGRPLASGNQSPDFYADAFAQAGIPRPQAKDVLRRLKADGLVKVRTWRNPETRKPGERLWADGTTIEGWVERGAP